MAPPTSVVLRGQEIDLVAVARLVCRRYDEEFPDERERYGPAGMEWCRHDNQHLLNWAALSVGGTLDWEAQLTWLARVLEARNFPLPRLARNLDLLAAAVRETYPGADDVAERVQSGAAFVSGRSTFLR